MALSFPVLLVGCMAPIRGGRDNRSPKRLSFFGARDGDVDSPACRAVGKHRTVGPRIGFLWCCRLYDNLAGHIVLGLLPCGETLNVGVEYELLLLSTMYRSQENDQDVPHKKQRVGKQRTTEV